jgi:GT2 family glycosyltransferase
LSDPSPQTGGGPHFHAPLTVGIPTYNGRELLEIVLPSLARQVPSDFRIVVVDDASSDDTVEWLTENWPQIEVIVHERNRGVTAALNACLGAAESEFVALLNNDVELEPDCLARLVEALTEHPEAAASCAKLIDYRDRELLDGAGDIWTWGGEAHRRGQGRRDTGQYDRPERIFSACGAAVVYRRSALEEVGVFDERFFANCEDTDWSFRANLLGWSVRYAPDAIAYHMGSATLGSGVSDFALFHNWRNGIWVVAKNYPLRSLLRHIPDLLLLQARNLAVSLVRGHLRVWLRAWASALAGLPAMLSKRRAIQRRRVCPVELLETLVGGEQ